MVMITTGREERRAGSVHLHEIESERIAVERDGALQIRNF
jgi:hypothetical protein